MIRQGKRYEFACPACGQGYESHLCGKLHDGPLEAQSMVCESCRTPFTVYVMIHVEAICLAGAMAE